MADNEELENQHGGSAELADENVEDAQQPGDSVDATQDGAQDDDDDDDDDDNESANSDEHDEPNADDDDDSGELVVSIGDDDEEAGSREQAPAWVRELRKSYREAQRQNRELRKKLEELEKPTSQVIDPGPKPKLDDFDFDTDRYEEALATWHERKLQAEAIRAQHEAEQRKIAEAWQQRLNAYAEARENLKVKDFEDAEAVATEFLDETQQGIIVQGADNAALVIYALGKNPAKAQELSAIKDPVKFAFTVAKLEKELRVKNRKSPPPPEKRVDGTGPKSGSVDSTLDRLRAEAAKTGDYSKVIAYRRQLRQKRA